MLFCRVTETYATLEGFFTSLADVCAQLVVYEHTASRTHVHFYTLGCTINTDSIKARIKKHLHVKSYDKNKWSFRTASDPNCITYMSKGVLEPCFVKGFTQEEISSYRDRWEDRSPETEPEQIKRKNGPTQYDMSMEVYQLIIDKYRVSTPLGIDVYELQQRDCDIYQDCIRFAIDICHKYRKGFDEYSIRKIITPAYTKFAHCRNQLVDKVFQNYFR